ncbi:hypothetical protein HAX54_015281, partial [Datura stramonium]|nr:hypothetical protein [Datura stramonium]
VTGKGREQMSTSLCSYLGNFENEVGSLSESALYPNQCIQTPSKVQDQVLPCLQVKKCEL